LLPFSSFFFFSPFPFARLYLGAIEAVTRKKINDGERKKRKRITENEKLENTPIEVDE